MPDRDSRLSQAKKAYKAAARDYARIYEKYGPRHQLTLRASDALTEAENEYKAAKNES